MGKDRKRRRLALRTNLWNPSWKSITRSWKYVLPDFRGLAKDSSTPACSRTTTRSRGLSQKTTCSEDDLSFARTYGIQEMRVVGRSSNSEVVTYTTDIGTHPEIDGFLLRASLDEAYRRAANSPYVREIRYRMSTGEFASALRGQGELTHQTMKRLAQRFHFGYKRYINGVLAP